jgi:hypothetical protein
MLHQPINSRIRDVWRHSQRTNNGDGRFKVAYQTAFRRCVHLLSQSLWREYGPPIAEVVESSLILQIGRTLSLQITEEPHLGTITPIGYPQCKTPRGAQFSIFQVSHFVRAIRCALSGLLTDKELEILNSSFENSHANLTLNYFLAASNESSSGDAERAKIGHRYYPFPSLCLGPTIDEISEFSPYAPTYSTLRLRVFPQVEFTSFIESSAETFFVDWSGSKFDNRLNGYIPVHPWALRKKLDSHFPILDTSVKIHPLISQRTVRVAGTGYDIKLPVEAILTGEHRLFYEINLRNAAAVSMLASKSVENLDDFSIQRDLATLWPSQEIRWPTCLGAIIREPIEVNTELHACCAIEFWDDIESGKLNPDKYGLGMDWISDYATTLLKGALTLWISGIAIEPHLQNVVLIFDRSKRLTKMKVRDLDGSILIRGPIEASPSGYQEVLAPSTWLHMPPPIDGLHRLSHAMIFGHLTIALSILRNRGYIGGTRLHDLIREWIFESALQISLKPNDADALLRSTYAVKQSLRMHLSGAVTNSYSFPSWLSQMSE